MEKNMEIRRYYLFYGNMEFYNIEQIEKIRENICFM